MPDTATLIVSRSHSTCGNCGAQTLPDATAHDTVSGYGAPRPGCGARFTAITTDQGERITMWWFAVLRSTRPDLPIAWPAGNAVAPGDEVSVDHLDETRPRVTTLGAHLDAHWLVREVDGDEAVLWHPVGCRTEWIPSYEQLAPRTPLANVRVQRPAADAAAEAQVLEQMRERARARALDLITRGPIRPGDGEQPA